MDIQDMRLSAILIWYAANRHGISNDCFSDEIWPIIESKLKQCREASEELEVLLNSISF